MQRKANRLLLLMIGTALAACSSTSEQGSSGVETEEEFVVQSTVQPPPPEPAPVQYSEAELDVGNLGPVEYADETVTYTEENVGMEDTGVSDPETFYQYPEETVEYGEEVVETTDTGVSEPEAFPDEPMEFPVTTYEITEEVAEPEIADLGAVEQPTETLSYAEEYVPEESAGVSAAEEYVIEEDVGELGPVDTPDETMVFPEETVYQAESVGEVTSYQSMTVNAEARPLFAFDKSDVRANEQYKLESVVTDLAGAAFETIWVVGHTDRIGTVEYNQGLSERRANAVKAFLVRLGIAGDKISTSGRGELMPVTTEAECAGMRGKSLIECYQPDRRVEVSVSAEVVQEITN